jgi:hypothetical protein
MQGPMSQREHLGPPDYRKMLSLHSNSAFTSSPVGFRSKALRHYYLFLLQMSVARVYRGKERGIGLGKPGKERDSLKLRTK